MWKSPEGAAFTRTFYPQDKRKKQQLVHSQCFEVFRRELLHSTGFHIPHPLWKIFVAYPTSPERGGGAQRRRGFRRYAEYQSENPRRIRTDPRCPLWGKCREAAKGVALVVLSRHHSSNNTPSVSLAGSEVPSSLPAPPLGSQEIVRIRLRFHKTVSACCNPSAAAAAAPLSGAL